MYIINKLNEKGQQVLEYKTELLKTEYSDLVRNAMYIAVDQLAENGIIDLDTHLALKDSSISLDDFKISVYEKISFLKSREELFEEYEIIRKALDNQLLIYNEETGDLTTKSCVENEQITCIKKYTIDLEFVMDYFGVDEKNALKIMQQKKMVDTYTALRLVKIFNDFIKNEQHENLNISVDATTPYCIDDDVHGITYNIDLKLTVDINSLENDSIINEVGEEFSEIISASNQNYNKKMLI